MGEKALLGETDHELVSKALGGDQKAFRRIVEAHHSMAYAVVRAILGNREDVEDVLQNVFIKIYRGLRKFRGESKLSTWIYQIARNEALNERSKPRREFEPVDDLEIPDPASTSPEAGLGDRLLRHRLEKALSHLDEEQRVALELKYMGDRSYREISETMGIPVGTVKTHIHRGKIELKRIMMRPQSLSDQKETGNL